MPTLEDRISALERTIEIEAATAARRMCLNPDGSRKKGGTFDMAYLVQYGRLTGRAPATYTKKREGLSPAQHDQATRAARARAECEQRRARGEKVNSDEVFKRICG